MKVLGIYGSPRRGGNTDLLLREMLRGCREAGAEAEEVFLREMKVTPCLEIYACKRDGECVIRDDMRGLYKKLVEADVVAVASPVFFYGVSAQVKAMIDRCQALWVKKYQLKRPISDKKGRVGVFLSVGGSQGSKIFDGSLLTMKYFFDALDMASFRTLLFWGIDAQEEILSHPSAMREAYDLGKEVVSPDK